MFNTVSKYFDPLLNAIEKLSKAHRIVICMGAFLVLVGCFVWLSFYPKFTDIERLNKEIEDLDRKLTIAKRKAQQLPRYREMMKQAEADFKIAKKALPEKKEIPSLLTGISRAGKEVGLEFLLFQPAAEIKKDFYAEIPVAIKVTGPYHKIAIFFDKVARLFRVVNITDINMAGKRGTQELDTSCNAITYRFIDSGPQEGEKKK